MLVKKLGTKTAYGFDHGRDNLSEAASPLNSQTKKNMLVADESGDRLFGKEALLCDGDASFTPIGCSGLQRARENQKNYYF